MGSRIQEMHACVHETRARIDGKAVVFFGMDKKTRLISLSFRRLIAPAQKIDRVDGTRGLSRVLPDLVVAAAAEVVDATRNHRRLDGKTLSAIASRHAP
jgi:hypothetical protein